MKSIYKLYISLFVLCLAYANAGAQCKSDDCVAKISDGYTFLKTYQMEKSGDQTEYSYVFSKETNYMLVICNKGNSAENIIVTLCDSQKKEIATNFDKKTGKYYPAIVYNCKATGIYYLKFTFKDSPECCVSVLSFKK